MKLYTWLPSFYILQSYYHIHNIVIFDKLEFITDYLNQSGNRKKIRIMTEELLFKVEELLSAKKLKLFAATFGIDGEQIKTSKGRRDL